MIIRRVLLLAVVVLAACGGPQEDLDAWTKEVRASVQPMRSTVEAPKKVEPFTYDNKNLLDPFSPAKLTVAIDKAAKSKSGSGLAPDTKRPHEVLENFPLESIKMVGRITNAKVNTALLQVDSLVYQAKVGNYAGQNFGRITKIDDSEVQLKELVQDATGDWVERETSLRIQEGVKK